MNVSSEAASNNAYCLSATSQTVFSLPTPLLPSRLPPYSLRVLVAAQHPRHQESKVPKFWSPSGFQCLDHHHLVLLPTLGHAQRRCSAPASPMTTIRCHMITMKSTSQMVSSRCKVCSEGFDLEAVFDLHLVLVAEEPDHEGRRHALPLRRRSRCLSRGCW